MCLFTTQSCDYTETAVTVQITRAACAADVPRGRRAHAGRPRPYALRKHATIATLAPVVQWIE